MPETSGSVHYRQPAPRWRLLPWPANPANPAMSPNTVRKTGTCHNVKNSEKGEEREGEVDFYEVQT